jgi:hypothetical protein
VDAAKVHVVCAEVYQLLSSLIPADQLRLLRERYDTILKDSSPNEEKAVVPDTGSALIVGDSTTAVTLECIVQSTSSESEAEAPSLKATTSCEDNSTNIVSALAVEADHLALCNSPDLIILSPPWGGPDYLHAKSYCLYTMLTSGCGLYLAMLAAAVAPSLLFLLPVNTDQEQVAFIADVIQMPFVIEFVSINSAPKVMAIYMGAIVARKQSIKVSKLATNVGTHSNHVHFAQA